MCSVKIKFASVNKILYSGEFESIIAKAFAENSNYSINKVILDFSDLNYIDVVTLPNISSFIQSYLKVTSNTIKVILPNNPKVLTFLKTWDFKDSFFNSTNKERELKECIDDSNSNLVQSFFNQSTEDDVGDLDEFTANCLNDPNLNTLLKELMTNYNPCSNFENSRTFEKYNKQKNFFSVFSFDVKKNDEQGAGANKNIVFEEKKRWQQLNEIESILDNVLKDKNGKECKGYIPNKVIWECTSNALRHPGGDLIQTTSRFISKEARGNLKTNHFTLAFWDNGESMIDTLRNAYQDTGKIKANLPERIHYPTFEVFTDDYSAIRVDTRILPGEFHLRDNTHDYYWFLSTFFPGVTRDPNPDGAFANESSIDTIFKYPGMGLYLLLKTVIDTFGGKVIARTSNYRMRVEASEKSDCNYKAEIKKVSSFSKEGFKGNLISIHLPLFDRIKR